MQKDPSPAHPKEGARLAFESSVAPYLKSLKAHCYRMCGSWFEAEDLLQESLVRAWRGLHTFRGDASLKTWLYSVTTRACLDLLEKRRERSLPFTLGLKSDGSTPPEGPDFEVPWIEPMPGEPDDEALGPEARLTRRESVALAFLALLQRVPPKQRAVLLLRDVLGSSAQECAALLETSVASVNSALQRARAALERVRPPPVKIESEAQRDLLARYVRAWENAEVDGLMALLADDATLAMPPLLAWYQGHEDIERQLRSMAMPPESKGTRRFQLTSANGLPAVAVWKRDSATQLFQAEAIQVLEISPDDRVRAITAFMDTRIFPSFGLATEMKGP